MSGMLKNIDSFPGQFGQGDISDAPRCLGNGHNSRPTSPLKFFARAKSKSNDMFKGIAEYVLEAEKFLKGMYTNWKKPSVFVINWNMFVLISSKNTVKNTFITHSCSIKKNIQENHIE